MFSDKNDNNTNNAGGTASRANNAGYGDFSEPEYTTKESGGNGEPQLDEFGMPKQPQKAAGPAEKPPENFIAGLVGALLFALAGGGLWYLLYQINFIAYITGLITVVCAIKGYSLFAKGESLRGTICSVVISVLVIVLAWYFCIVTDLYNTIQEAFLSGEVDWSLTYGEAFSVAYRLLLEDFESLIHYIWQLAVGLAACGIGSFGFLKAGIARAKRDKNA